MKKYHIKVTDEEKVLVEAIDLRLSHGNHLERHAAHEANKRPILALLQSLFEREAIPEERLRYWKDPAYNTSSGKASHRDVFERNGCMGWEIFAHPHFPSLFPVRCGPPRRGHREIRREGRQPPVGYIGRHRADWQICTRSGPRISP